MSRLFFMPDSGSLSWPWTWGNRIYSFFFSPEASTAEQAAHSKHHLKRLDLKGRRGLCIIRQIGFPDIEHIRVCSSLFNLDSLVCLPGCPACLACLTDIKHKIWNSGLCNFTLSWPELDFVIAPKDTGSGSGDKNVPIKLLTLICFVRSYATNKMKCKNTFISIPVFLTPYLKDWPSFLSELLLLLCLKHWKMLASLKSPKWKLN